MIEIIKAVIIGIIQGISEWLPISSTGHMIIFNSFFPMNISLGYTAQSQAFWGLFLVVIQLSSIAAVLIIYFHKLNPFSPKKSKVQKQMTFNLWLHVLVASVPAAVVGLALNDWIESKMQTVIVVAVALIVYGVFFILMEQRQKKSHINTVETIDYKTAFLIGAFQLLAIIPGTSRSGATILGAVLLGCSRMAASEFSFFCAIPAMVGASGIRLIKYLSTYGVDFNSEQIIILTVASVVSFVVSIAAIKYFMQYIRKHDFKVFGYYRIVLGTILILCFIFGVQMNMNV